MQTVDIDFEKLYNERDAARLAASLTPSDKAWAAVEKCKQRVEAAYDTDAGCFGAVLASRDTARWETAQKQRKLAHEAHEKLTQAEAELARATDELDRVGKLAVVNALRQRASAALSAADDAINGCLYHESIDNKKVDLKKRKESYDELRASRAQFERMDSGQRARLGSEWDAVSEGYEDRCANIEADIARIEQEICDCEKAIAAVDPSNPETWHHSIKNAVSEHYRSTRRKWASRHEQFIIA